MAAKVRAGLADSQPGVPRSSDRLPPGQHLTQGFPILDLGIKPEIALADWRLEIGGLVEKGTLKRDNDGLTVRFTVSDTVNNIPVVYKGILPDLFKEGRGCVAQGHVGNDGVFYAESVLAKHDENYMPPEAAQSIEKAKRSANEASKTLVDK